MSDQETIDTDPIGEIFDEAQNGEAGSGYADPDDREESDAGSEEEQQETSSKERVTVAVPEELADRLRNAVYWTAADITMSDLSTEGIRAAVKHIEEERNDGEPFPSRENELRGGRPIK